MRAPLNSSRVVISLLLTISAPCLFGQWGQSYSHYSGDLPTLPGTTALDTTGNTGNYFSYYNSTWGTETANAKLSDYYYQFYLPGAFNGTFSTGQGAWSAMTYPPGPFWPVNVGDFAQVGCTPGLTCGVCGSSGADCYNWNIPRWPAIGMRSSQFNSSNGIDAWATLTAGNVSGGTEFVNVIFYHDSPVYLSGNEYGIYFDEVSGNTYFYFGYNSNCTDAKGNSICSLSEGDTSKVIPVTNSEPGPFQLNLGTRNSGYCHYQIYVWNTGGTYQFLVRVRDQYGKDLGDSPWLVNPGSFPSYVFANSAGYVTFGIQRYDPTCDPSGSPVCQTYTSAPFMYVGSVAKFN